MNKPKKHLSIVGLLKIVRHAFQSIKMPQVKGTRKVPQTLTDCLMSATAMFGLKYPSLLSFDEAASDEEQVKHNLSTLYGINQVPSDTYMRERLDEVDPKSLRKPFKAIFAQVQRGKSLEGFRFIGEYYLISADGTGFFSSPKVHCSNCCIKNHKDGSKTYYHQMYCAAIVHPKQKTVIPFPPEAIMKDDGSTKNDCEFNAAKRFNENFRKEHPHLPVIMTGDGLTSKAPLIKDYKKHNMRFILAAKPGDHKYLFEFVKSILKTFHHKTKDGKAHEYRYVNKVPLNESNPDEEINFLYYIETDSKGKTQHFSWVTDIEITEGNVHQIMIGARSRWKIENEVFNTLKNQNYHFEHNFGHGKKNLSTAFAMLMMLAFLIDQVQLLCDYSFQQALTKYKRLNRLWGKMRGLFFNFFIDSWDDFWNAIIHGHRNTLNSS